MKSHICVLHNIPKANGYFLIYFNAGKQRVICNLLHFGGSAFPITRWKLKFFGSSSQRLTTEHDNYYHPTKLVNNNTSKQES